MCRKAKRETPHVSSIAPLVFTTKTTPAKLFLRIQIESFTLDQFALADFLVAIKLLCLDADSVFHGNARGFAGHAIIIW
jgi:lipopolysaccharide biosynthesis glycosyltransferase